MRRSIHTFKGAAGVVGFRSASQLAHRMEDLLEELYEGSRPLTAPIKDLLLATFDALDAFVRTRGQAEAFDQTAQALARLMRSSGRGTCRGCRAARSGPTTRSRPNSPVRVSPWSVAVVPAPMPCPRHRANRTPPGLFRQSPACSACRLSASTNWFAWSANWLSVARMYEQHLERLTRQVDELRLSIERLQRTTTTVETQYEVRALMDQSGMPAARLL